MIKLSLKKAETLLNSKEKCKMFNQDVRDSLEYYQERYVILMLNMFWYLKMMIVKIKINQDYKEFDHASSNNLKSLFKNAGCLNEENCQNKPKQKIANKIEFIKRYPMQVKR